ncbi:hypothetical protein PHJA_000349700 [Phtheirospermum japonicum]|uniref:Phorbol-ester/DAG-type domain-containing protein n=1 Tax=Phtheirospermum japonicum TaxID=374723 RepID=A0A830BBB3_9LAMI|nr:hypothetical protein PHJA_000349700 [Phtheirospermum japonicum]
MEIIRHFGHDEHPLTFREDEKAELDYKPYLCSICGLPILSSPSYTCTEASCDFILHKACAQLPRELKYTSKIHLKLKSSRYRNPNCSKCRKSCLQNFTYTNDAFDINLHPLCATPVVIKTKHKSHLQHPLVAICNENSCHCDACGEKHEGFFFSCQECNFWINKDCALLPSNVKHASHHHPFMLTYALSDLHQFHHYVECEICKNTFSGKGVYFCGKCSIAVHLNCVSSNMEILTSGQEMIHLASGWDRFPSWLEREDDTDTDKSKSQVEKYHTSTSSSSSSSNHHPLILFHKNHPSSSSSSAILGTASKVHDDDHQSSISTQELGVCNGCTQPIINIPFWGCRLQPNCNFLLHHFCANLPHKINFEVISAQLLLRPDTTKYYFYSVFFCFLCCRPCNGFAYSIHEDDTDDSSFCDVECALAPKTATHASHRGQHVLFLTDPPVWSTIIPFSCCPDESHVRALYRCVTCDFVIHCGCALLPQKVRHKFDKHPLELIFTNNTDCWVEKECCFCEFCEQDIDQRYWFYHCADCDHSFHIKCIPSVGLLSKVKFGGTLDVPCHPRHPVTLTRMLMESNQRCGYCKDIIPGFVDDMAFYCSDCEFWIHFRCARDCTNDPKQGHAARLWYDRNKYSDRYFAAVIHAWQRGRASKVVAKCGAHAQLVDLAGKYCPR